jgi:4a-hydroxytetrahydrobiopterin dehydratase
MAELAKGRCEPCQKGAPQVTPAQTAELLPQVPGWTVVERDGIKRLERSFTFPDFAGALAFTVRVGQAAEREDHHPVLVTEWGRVKVSWWTHKIRGLHQNDFIMAAKTNEAYGG